MAKFEIERVRMREVAMQRRVQYEDELIAEAFLFGEFEAF